MATDTTTPTIESLLAHSGWVRDLARALVFDPSRVDDVVQETWAAALTQPRQRVRDPRAWLGGIARNVVRESNRGEARRRRREERAARAEDARGRATAPSAGDLALRVERQTRVSQAVLELAEPYRSTLLRHYFDELSAAEIARRTGESDSTVRTRIARGLAQLRERFDDESGGDRRAWCLAMLPLSLPPDGASVASDAVPTIATKSGTAPMSLTPTAMTAALLGTASLGLGLTLWAPWESSSPAPDRDPNVGVVAVAELPSAGQDDVTDDVAALAVAGGSQPASARREAEAPAATLPPGQISGVVLDQSGQPVAGATIFVGAEENPFAEDSNAEIEGEDDRFPIVGTGQGVGAQLAGLGYLTDVTNSIVGRSVATDSAGRFNVEIEDPGRVFLALGDSFGVRAVAGERQWVDAPAVDLHFNARRLPTSTISIELMDVTTGVPIDPIKTELVARDQSTGESSTTDGDAEYRLDFEDDRATDYELRILEPLWAASRRELELTPGVDLEVDIEVASGPGLRGRVTDPAGAPVAGATLFWGPVDRIRQAPTFGASDVQRVQHDSVVSAGDGTFVLPGWVDQLTGWHPDWSPRTVTSAAGVELRLERRGSLRGRAFDDAGQPLANATVRIDHGQFEVTTDDDGAYHAEALEAGAYLVREPGRPWLQVEVRAGEELNLEPEGRLDDARLELTVDGQPFDRELWGLAIARAPIVWTQPFKLSGDGIIQLDRAHVGQRLVLASAQDLFVEVVVEGPRTRVEVGGADLTIEAGAGSAYLVPADVTDFERLHIADSLGRFGPAQPSTAVTYEFLAPGEYLLCDRDGLVLRTVRVDGHGSTIEIGEQPSPTQTPR